MPISPKRLLHLLHRITGEIRQRDQVHGAAVTGGYLIPNPPNKMTIITKMPSLLYNALIVSYINTNNPTASFKLFIHMLSNGAALLPSTFPSLLKSASTFSLYLSFSLYSLSLKLGFSLYPFLLTSILSLRSHPLTLRHLFDEMPPRPSVASRNAMISVLSRSGDISAARHVFDEMLERDVFSWTAMISGLKNNCRFREGLYLFREMMRDGRVRPTEPTYVTVLSMCPNRNGGLGYGRQIHGYVVKCDGELSVFVCTALVSMYGKFGCVETAVRVINRMVRIEVCVWNAVVSLLGSNGREGEALVVLGKMEVVGIRPNEVTFVGMLNACAKAEFVEMGIRIFRSMVYRYDVVPKMKHYGCIVNLLGRAGLLKEACDFVRKMPIEADDSILRSLLFAFRVHGALELGGEVGRRLIALQPEKCGGYVTLSSLYAAAENWDRASYVRGVMRDVGISKLHACSYVSV